MMKMKRGMSEVEKILIIEIGRVKKKKLMNRKRMKENTFCTFCDNERDGDWMIVL